MKNRFSGFTMAEILISLTIIGIIVAITLPSLRANINEKTWATQRKALYSRLSQAISMMPSLNGYGEYDGTWNNDDTVSVVKDTAAARFVTDGLAKVLQINNICTIPANTSSENALNELKKCGIPNSFTNIKNSKLDFPTNLTELNPMFTSTLTYTNDNNVVTAIYKNPQHNINTNAAAFETKNGESVAVFYNPYCQAETDNFQQVGSYTQTKMCANFIYDLNGRRGPNKVGKDIGFITALYPTDSIVVAPMPLEKNVLENNPYTQTVKQTKASEACRKQDKDSRVPTHEELLSMFYNGKLAGGVNDSGYWSNTIYKYDSNRAWYLHAYNGIQISSPRTGSARVRCIKK